MDTRTKIVGLDEARAAAARERRNGRRVRLVTGYFDPVLAAHASALEEMSDSSAMFVAVGNPVHELLGAAARAELVAGLRCVDYVVAGEAGAVEAAVEPDETVHREQEDGRLARELILHVHGRQSAR